MQRDGMRENKRVRCSTEMKSEKTGSGGVRKTGQSALTAPLICRKNDDMRSGGEGGGRGSEDGA